MVKKSMIIICGVLLILSGCATVDTKPDTMPSGLPDYGTIPILDPIKPPSLTNEWDTISLEIENVINENMVNKQASTKLTIAVLTFPFKFN